MNNERHVVFKKEKATFYVDWRRAEIVFDALVERLASRGIPYNSAHVPQADQFLPKNLEHKSREHALFLFSLCLWMRGGVESDTAAEFLKNMYERRPEVFNPDNFWNWGANSTFEQVIFVTDALNENRLNQRVEENAPGWVYNMRKLARFYNGDPRKLMDDQPRFKTLAKRIIGKTRDKSREFCNEDSKYGFMFFREKMVAMLAYFFMDTELVPVFFTPVPVDFHVLRLLVANRIIRARGKDLTGSIGINFMKPKVLKLAREVTEWYCRTKNVSPIALCDSLWLLSRTLCRANPGNSGYVADASRQTTTEKIPLSVINELGLEFDDTADRSTLLHDDPIPTGRKRYLGLKFTEHQLLTRQGLLARMRKTCGHCPVNQYCSYNISSGSYYVGGMLLPERLRVEPSNHQADFLETGDFKKTLHAPLASGVRFASINVSPSTDG